MARRVGRQSNPEDPLEFRRKAQREWHRRLNAAERKRQQHELMKKIEELERKRRVAARKGGFIDVLPEAEKGIFLHSIRLKNDGSIEKIIYDSKKTEFKAQREAAENLRRELAFYAKALRGAKEDIVLYDRPNLFVFIRKGKSGAAKVVVEKNQRAGVTEHTTYYFDGWGKLVIEHVREKHN